jgi:hypothetical protein
LTAEILLACKFPVTVTEPNVVVPPELVDVSVNQAAALVSPSVGQTFKELEFVSYHNFNYIYYFFNRFCGFNIFISIIII